MKNQSQKTPLTKAEKETILTLLNSLIEEVRTAIEEIRVVKSMIEKGGCNEGL